MRSVCRYRGPMSSYTWTVSLSVRLKEARIAHRTSVVNQSDDREERDKRCEAEHCPRASLEQVTLRPPVVANWFHNSTRPGEPALLNGPALRRDFLQSNGEANLRVNGDIMWRPSQAQQMERTLQTSVEEHGSRRRDAIGPLGSASQEIRLASERYAIWQIRSRRMISPLMRTDQMLAALEELNMLDVERVPESWLWELGELVADLPFEYDPKVGKQPSPTAAIDLVFDIQERLLELITGIEAEHEERLEAAS
jgi:hypothetical protein